VAEQAYQDWIDHDGAGCPVSDLARVQVQFRADHDRRAAERLSGEQGNVAHAYSDSWIWAAGSDCPVDIVAHRVVA
jgi:hypothetical protein